MANIRFLGNACIEIISKEDHIIIDPVFVMPPKQGIETVYLTHHHPDHVTLDNLTEIREKFSKASEDLLIYGPESIYEEFNIDFILIMPGSQINLNNGNVDVFENNCWKAEGCISYFITIDGKKILHTADSASFSNQLRNLKEQIDCCFVACFEDNFNDYLRFLKEISPKIAIPYHFTAEKETNAKKLVEFLKGNNINSRFLAIGEEIEL